MTQIPAPPSAPRLIAIPRLAAGGRWRVEAMRALSEPLFLWFTKGQGRITVAGATRGYTPHNAIFIPAGTMHGFEVGPQVFGTAVFFGRDCGLPLPAQPLHLRIRENSAQVDLNLTLDAIGREMAGDKPAHDRAAGYHLGLLSVWLERQAAAHPLEDAPHPASARRLAARFTQLLERDFRSGMGVADYAAALGVTPTHLTRVCRTTTGRPAKDLLQDRVLFEARRLLAETALPVQEVARGLGFNSPAYFTRAFQQHTGKTPSDFRRSA
ncbi:helix-turn-helix domain-containing protein [Ruixingdingia sedimenti]|uniref:AraC family transcriptional regulator n=1 Tax=Ruixingdingia sedimenti TaxID=3073604 RepID=A0ABU1F328_9RHOB|nr:AraC family transcriptional regulator [Xinfangfangia sp. LG-4]MDR5651275.1 AraC family transcriptional regulator [Xinfangfangia sp. LG-4]